MKNRVKRKGVYALLSFLILVVASQPFLSIYHFKDFYFFVVMIGCLCLITLLVKSHLLRVPLYFLTSFFTLHHYFSYHQSFGWSWFVLLKKELVTSYQQMRLGELGHFSDLMSLSIILLFLILLVILLIEYERWLFNYLLITGYLLLLVVVNTIPLALHILIITSAFLFFYHYQQSSFSRVRLKKKRFFLLMGITLLLVGSTAYYFPQLFPTPKNLLLAQTRGLRSSLNKQGFYQSIQRYSQAPFTKTGFSEKDEQLGGPLLDDQTVLFTASQANKHYWRVETKNLYTGNGWRSSSDKEILLDAAEVATITDKRYLGAFLEDAIIDLSFEDESNYLPQPYGKIILPLDSTDQTIEIIEKNRINFKKRPQNLSLIYQAPRYTKEELQLAPEIQLDSQEQKETTQVPATVPERVKSLAEELTENETNQYDKVKKIEAFLHSTGGYRYSKIDTPYTPNQEDYVDYFLFESKIGYCNNYSSAMVVLLRSVGIPSRWAKGFAPGERSYDPETAQTKYTIRNSDAHSWSEVYFEGYGWIPFEPTPSFNNPISSSNPTNTESTNSESSDPSALSSTSVEPASQPASSSNALTKNRTTNTWYQDLAALLPVLKNIGLGLLILLGSCLVFYYKKYFFLFYFTGYRLLFPKKFIEAYRIILKKAEKKLYRHDNEPLNDYAQRFEKNYPHFQGAFIQLTHHFEHVLYSANPQPETNHSRLLTQNATLLTKIPASSNKKK